MSGLQANTDDSILMRRHLKPSLQPIYTGHIEPMRYDTAEVCKVNPWSNLILVSVGLLITAFIMVVPLLFPHP